MSYTSAEIEQAQRAAVVAEARSWLGTPYHNCADIKGAGVDCGMLIVRVFVDAGLVAPFDPRPYPPDWHLHRGEEKYLGFIFDRLAEVAAPQPGDVAVFRIGRCYSHGGIVTAVGAGLVPALGRPGSPLRDLRIVHAYYQARSVLEDEVLRDAFLSDPARKPRFFSFWARTAFLPHEVGEGDHAKRGGGGAPPRLRQLATSPASRGRKR